VAWGRPPFSATAPGALPQKAGIISASTKMSIQVETFAKSSDAPAQISPELVLVSPPEEARAAREALAEPPAEPARLPAAAPRAEVLRQAGPVEAPVAPTPPPRPAPERPAQPPPPAPPAPVQRQRRRSRWLLVGFALVLAAGGFAVGRELGRRHDSGAAATRPGASEPASQPAATTAPAQSTGTRSTSSGAGSESTRPPSAPQLPVVSWKPQRGVRHYRLDLVRQGAVVLTILTDEPQASIPRTFPNAGRRSHLVRGTYQWRVRAATARPSRILASGLVKLG
jgi:hypothetical protein